MSPRRRISDQPHPAYASEARWVVSAILLFWAVVIAAIRWSA
jgi:hypothetical protein